MKNAYATYRTANVDTADQGKLILIAYDVAIKHCKLAMEQFGSHEQVEARTKNLFKVQDAISELMSALQLDVGEIAKNLYSLYDYMLRRAIEANARNKKECVEEILGYLTDLRGAWVDAIQQVKQQQASSGAQGQNVAFSG
jgi:flagellar protein FliS